MLTPHQIAEQLCAKTLIALLHEMPEHIAAMVEGHINSAVEAETERCLSCIEKVRITYEHEDIDLILNEVRNRIHPSRNFGD